MGSSLPNPMSDSQFLTLVQSAFERVRAELMRTSSFLSERVWQWMTHLSGSLYPEDYYLNPRSAPILFLPWWLEGSLAAPPDRDFQTDLIYATINKYYSVRLIDDVMDAHDPDPVILPMLSVWDAQFQETYSRHFPANHPFWQYFHQILQRSAAVTAEEATFRNIDLPAFLNFSAAKSCGATIAMLAVCYRRGRLDSFPAWVRFWEVFARWNQLRDDLFDWHRDLEGGIPSYLLSEGERRKTTEESVSNWFVREGFAWATGVLGEWTRDMKRESSQLNSPKLEQYVELRATDLDRQIADTAARLKSLATLSGLELS